MRCYPPSQENKNRVQYLLDTHVLLWWLTTPDEISHSAKKIISNKSNTIFISSVSFWEMAIKKSLGRLTFPHNLLEIVASESFLTLPITPEEGLGVTDLPPIYSNPFDRLLVIQAKLHHLTLISRDSQFKKYPITLLKA